MDMRQAVQIGKQIARELDKDDQIAALSHLSPILAARTRFPYLQRIGETLSKRAAEQALPFLELIARQGSEGSWVVIGGCLKSHLQVNLIEAHQYCRRYIIMADIWYGADILGERVPGPGLLTAFDKTLLILEKWRSDSNPWVRRSVGVAVHHWTKRAGGDSSRDNRVKLLLDLLDPMFTEWAMPAAKGVGWALKTIGKYHPDLLMAWLPPRLKRKHRAVVRRKAVTYLPDGFIDSIISA